MKYKWAQLILGLVLLATGATSCMVAADNMTPASVSVRGYTRRDGSYVRPHSRRPPGSRRRDAPYELMNLVGFVLVIGGGMVTWSATPGGQEAAERQRLQPRPEKRWYTDKNGRRVSYWK